ncbi:MAG: ankyrin repeat domain-containing protein, partial [Alphaproteobacteria bacterium]|nr:ankyrin repeat domain-containing protein [Alphaproteobacteria bacterium]
MIKFILSLAFGITPLHVAAAMDNDSAIFDLVKNGAKVDAKTYWGATALHWAASTGADKAIRALINANADIGARNRYGNNAVLLAVIANKAIALCTFRI